MGTLGDIKDIGILALMGVGAYLIFKFGKSEVIEDLKKLPEVGSQAWAEDPTISGLFGGGGPLFNPPGMTGRGTLWSGIYENTMPNDSYIGSSGGGGAGVR